jgi:hypothetical protein
MTSDAEIRALIERLNDKYPVGTFEEAAAALSALLEERDKLDHECQASMKTIADEREQFEARITVLEQKLAKARALEPTVEFVARMAWRSDPPNANNPFTPAERFNAIQWHPTIREFGKPHRELAAKEDIDSARSTLEALK